MPNVRLESQASIGSRRELYATLLLLDFQVHRHYTDDAR